MHSDKNSEEKNIQNKKKHIAMYISSLQKGGAERVMVNLAEYFYSAGYKVTLVTTYMADTEYEVKDALWKRVDTGRRFEAEDSSFVTEKDSEGLSGKACETISDKEESDESTTDWLTIPVLNHAEKGAKVRVYTGTERDGIHRVFSGLLREEQSKNRVTNFTNRLNKLTKVWTDIKPDLILSFIGKNNVMALMTAGNLHIPVVVSCRANPRMEYEQRGTRYSAMMLYRKAAGLVVQTNGAKEFFPKKVQEKAVILPNSLNPDFIRPPFDGEREKTIVMVGRIDENKNHELVLRAFAEADKKYPGFRVKFYGTGPCVKKLTELSMDLGIADLVSFEGMVSNVADQIQNAGIFVLASDEEGMPNALLEAMALGLPCISTDCPCGGPADLIRDGYNGLLVPVRDKDAMVKALEKLMNNRKFGAELGKKAMQVQKDYAPDKINLQWKNYLDSFMK